MVSVSALLNPLPPCGPLSELRQSCSSAFTTAPALTAESCLSGVSTPMTEANQLPFSQRNLPACKSTRGMVNYPPFENLTDEVSLQEIRRFRVQPFGTIQQQTRRIPYNSTKKEFYAKTGRDSFEVFQYDFIRPGENCSYTVMWDYKIGLVRMTPFFKSCKYSKTTPARMLNQNPGLKDITHSITGGAIKAQGYWMPFECARAVCRTFCYEIAGGLIPLFGPTFPSECALPNTPDHGRMIIDQSIVAKARRDAEVLLRLNKSRGVVSSGHSLPRCASPRPMQRPLRSVMPHDYPTPYGRHPTPYQDANLGSAHGSRSSHTLPPWHTAGRFPVAGEITKAPSQRLSWQRGAQDPPHYLPNHHYFSAGSHGDGSVHGAAHPWLTAVPQARVPSPAKSRSQHYCYQLPPPAPRHPSSECGGSYSAGRNNCHQRPNKRPFDSIHAGNDDQMHAGRPMRSGSTHPTSPSSTNPGHNEDDDYGAASPHSPMDLDNTTPTTPSVTPPRSFHLRGMSATHKSLAPITLPPLASLTVGCHDPVDRLAAEADAALMLMHLRSPTTAASDSQNEMPASPPPGESPRPSSSAEAENINREDDGQSSFYDRGIVAPSDVGVTGQCGQLWARKRRRATLH